MKQCNFLIVLMICLLPLAVGCGNKSPKPEKVVVSINDYRITASEFEEGFQQSAFAAREDKPKARQEYLDNLVNQKLILLDAQKKGIDRQMDFLKSIERFWEQSLLTVAIGAKSKEITGAIRVPEDNIKRLYEQMIKDGVTTKSYQEMYPQIKWQSERQMESQMLNDWVDSLRRNARVKVDESLLKADK